MDELDREDQIAVGWAWTTRSLTGQVLRDRRARGEDPSPTNSELSTIRQEWEAAGRPAPDHHLHRTAVELGNGTSVTAVSFLGGEPYLRDAQPALGLYLDPRWDPPWPHEHLAWPDFGVPDADTLHAALRKVLARALRGDAVEIGCLGGHGRTGTALACLAVMTGTPQEHAVDWVRAHYCADAVETSEQQSFVEMFKP